MAVFKDLAMDGGVLAALDEDESGVPAVEVFDQEAVLLDVKLLEPGGRDAVARWWAGLVAEDGGKQPEVRVTLGEDEVIAEGGQDGVVDRGCEGGDGGAGREIAEEGWVGDGLRLLDVGREGLGAVKMKAGEVEGKRESEEGEGRGCGSAPGGWLEAAQGFGAEELRAQGQGEKAKGG